MKNQIIQGDCLIKLKELKDNSVDSIVTDPPAGISFMGKSWDSNKGGRDNWIKWMSDVAVECKRVLKPGGHAFVWAIPRTSHWTTTAWENAGFEIRDVVAHIFGSGFPKSHNIGISVAKLRNEELKEVGDNPNHRESDALYALGFQGGKGDGKIRESQNEWSGWGTALKPAREDWILMRKPLEKGLSIAENCLKYGTGGINIDESRVGTVGGGTHCDNRDSDGNCLGHKNAGKSTSGETIHAKETNEVIGRFPANLILSWNSDEYMLKLDVSIDDLIKLKKHYERPQDLQKNMGENER